MPPHKSEFPAISNSPTVTPHPNNPPPPHISPLSSSSPHSTVGAPLSAICGVFIPPSIFLQFAFVLVAATNEVAENLKLKAHLFQTHPQNGDGDAPAVEVQLWANTAGCWLTVCHRKATVGRGVTYRTGNTFFSTML